MTGLGISGVTRAKRPRTTIPDTSADRPTDLVGRDFAATRPNQLWVADFTYVPTWDGTVYVAFIVDAFSRMIVGWRAATRMTTPLVLDALEMALWTRRKQGVADLAGRFITPMPSRRANSIDRRNTLTTEVFDGATEEAGAAGAGRCTAAVGGG